MALSTVHAARSTRFAATSLALLVLSACGTNLPEPRQTASAEQADPLPELEGKGSTGPAGRKVGELLVHRFSGAFSKEPMILTEEVMSSDGNSMVVEYRLSEGDKMTHLRVLHSARSERVLEVSRIVGEEVIAASATDFEALLARTSFVPDRNDGLLHKKSQTCLLGKREMDCEISEFQVQLGEREARLSVTRDSAGKRDLSGEITAVDGTVLYHAELIEMREGRDAAEGAAESESKSAALDF